LRFPLRLAVDLTRARIAQRVRRDSDARAILFLRPMEEEPPCSLHAGEISVERNPGTELLARVRTSPAAVVWIGGPEPLLHPEMGQLTRCIAGHGQHVFLETNGALLRRRIHEFRPVSRLYLTVQLDGLEPSHNLRAGRGDAFKSALEGIRAAKLSGFQICVHVRIDRTTDLGETDELLRFLEATDVDGLLISEAPQSLKVGIADRETLQRKTAEARKLIHNTWWEFFSRLVDRALDREHHREQNAAPARSIKEEAEEAGTSDESVRVV
jgi:molybdenum cofactor biosynthesis enzyme MoaA